VALHLGHGRSTPVPEGGHDIELAVGEERHSPVIEGGWSVNYTSSSRWAQAQPNPCTPCPRNYN
jgi:hypothetical protein